LTSEYRKVDTKGVFLLVGDARVRCGRQAGRGTG